MKRQRQSAVRHKARPLALLNFVVNKTASFFLYSFRQFATWKRNWIKDDKRSNSLKIKAFSVCRNYTVRAYLCHPLCRERLWRQIAQRDPRACQRQHHFAALCPSDDRAEAPSDGTAPILRKKWLAVWSEIHRSGINKGDHPCHSHSILL